MDSAHLRFSGSGAVDLRESADNIEKCFVGTSSSFSYSNKLMMVMFAVWFLPKASEEERCDEDEKDGKTRRSTSKAWKAKKKRKKKEKKKEKRTEKEQEKKQDDQNHLRMICYVLLVQVFTITKGETP